jgi:hypothetical protein
VVLALIVYIAAKVVEHRNPPLGNFVEVDGAGALAHALSDAEGASDFLHGAFAVYSKAKKVSAVGVPEAAAHRYCFCMQRDHAARFQGDQGDRPRKR